MSVYSGFATRSQEVQYDSLLYNILTLLALRITKFYRNQLTDDEGFLKILKMQNKDLKRMETHKYMDPKYSTVVSALVNKIRGKQNSEAYEVVNHNYDRDQIHQCQNIVTMNSEVLYKPYPNETVHRIISLQKIDEKNQKKIDEQKESQEMLYKRNGASWRAKQENQHTCYSKIQILIIKQGGQRRLEDYKEQSQNRQLNFEELFQTRYDEGQQAE